MLLLFYFCGSYLSKEVIRNGGEMYYSVVHRKDLQYFVSPPIQNGHTLGHFSQFYFMQQ